MRSIQNFGTIVRERWGCYRGCNRFGSNTGSTTARVTRFRRVIRVRPVRVLASHLILFERLLLHLFQFTVVDSDISCSQSHHVVLQFVTQPSCARKHGRRGLGTVLRQITGNSTAGRDMLGHEDEGVTKDHYEGKLPEVALAAMKLLEAKATNGE